MATRSVSFAEGEFYHLYNRGVDKRIIFNDEADYKRFQQLLFLANTTDAVTFRNIKKQKGDIYSHDRKEALVSIGAYMSNA